MHLKQAFKRHSVVFFVACYGLFCADYLWGGFSFKFRKDLVGSISKKICSKSLDTAANNFWGDGIFDASLQIHLLKRTDTGVLEDASLRDYAISMMKNNFHHGYAFAICSSDLAWVASVPAEKALQVKDKQVSLPWAHMQNICKTIEGNFIQLGHGQSESVGLKNGKMRLNSYPPGVFSITCTPRVPGWVGPILWYLFPNDSSEKKVPFFELLRDGNSSKLAMERWINRLRSEHELKTFEFSNRWMKEGARNIGLSRKLFHERDRMDQVRQFLKKYGIKAGGEDKAIAGSVEELAWLLWFSPRHRDLLLDPNCSHAGSYLSVVGRQKYFVLLTGSLDSTKMTKNSHKNEEKKSSKL